MESTARALRLLLPASALGVAGLLLAPAPSTQAYSKIGGSLGEDQRDLRVFDNFLDATAHDNAVPSAQFPGWKGVELAIWKGAIEWSSTPHGDGSGDPQNGNVLGSGGANFDPMWAGSALEVGGLNDNIVSAIADCGGGGTLAYTEIPISNGWRIRFCDEHAWDDGPDFVGARFDVQSVMCHEYGHALGLGHSAVSAATMAPSVGRGSTALRSIEPDDVAGVQCIYGVASAAKPVITATVASAGLLTLHGRGFAPSGNEVWFASAAPTAAAVDPIVSVSGLASAAGGTEITVAIPAGAGPGDVLVNGPGTGGATLSNAFPTDLAGTFGLPPVPHPWLGGITPLEIEALVPGTAQTVVLAGAHLDLATALFLDGAPIERARWTIVSASEITLDMPQASALGAHDLAASDGTTTSSFPVAIVAPGAPVHELASGDPLCVVDRDDGLVFRLGGVPGRTQRLFASLSDQPLVSRFAALALGAPLVRVGDFVIPPEGWLEVRVPPGALLDPGPAGLTFYSQSLELLFPPPLAASNLQSIVLVQ